MNAAELIEKAFCGAVHSRRLLTGALAVSTDFVLMDGDRVGFFVEHKDGLYRLVDDGLTVPLLEAQGISLRDTRASAFGALLTEYHARLDADEGEIATAWLALDDLPTAAMRFVSLRLRMQDFLLLHPDMVASTFKDDVQHAIEETFRGRAEVAFNTILSDRLSDITVDAVISADGTVAPLAVFFAPSDKRILEAQVLRLHARYREHIDVRVISIIESMETAGLSRKGLQRAMNDLDRVLVFRGEEQSAMRELESYLFPKPLG